MRDIVRNGTRVTVVLVTGSNDISRLVAGQRSNEFGLRLDNYYALTAG